MAFLEEVDKILFKNCSGWKKNIYMQEETCRGKKEAIAFLTAAKWFNHLFEWVLIYTMSSLHNCRKITEFGWKKQSKKNC